MATPENVHEALGDEEMTWLMSSVIREARLDPDLRDFTESELGFGAFTAAVKVLGRSYSPPGSTAVINASIELSK